MLNYDQDFIEVSEGERVTFSISIENNGMPNQPIDIVFESDLDGELSSGSVSGSGIYSFETDHLSSGIHELQITARTQSGYTTLKTYSLSALSPLPLTLNEAEKESGTIHLEWSEYPGDDFLEYRIYAKSFSLDRYVQVGDAILNKEITTFIHEMPFLAVQTGYVVRVITTGETGRNGNEVFVDYPAGPVFDFPISEVLKHPFEPYLYVISQINSRIIQVDYSTMNIVQDIVVSGGVNYCEVGNTGQGVELYAAGKDGQIYIYDASNLELKTSIDTGAPLFSLSVDDGGHILACKKYSSIDQGSIRVYRRSDAVLVSELEGVADERIRKIPGASSFISINRDNYSVFARRYSIDADGVLTQTALSNQYSTYAMDERLFRISEDGTYFISSGRGTIFSTNNQLEYQGVLESDIDPYEDYADFAFDENGPDIYAAIAYEPFVQVGTLLGGLTSELACRGGRIHF